MSFLLLQVRLCALKIQSESEEIKPGEVDYRYIPFVIFVEL